MSAAVLLLIAALLQAACRVERPASPAAAGGSAAAGAPARSASYPNIVCEKNVAVPMRDGVVLRADVWRPVAAGRYPTLVMRTPYGRDNLPGDGSEATITRGAHAGYAVVVQDVRGRYGSEGTFDPYRQEGKDGYDTIEWAAEQPWSNGRVGTFGLSYPGAVQWLAAMESPPHLAAIFPAMTFATGRQFFYFGGAFNHDWMRWILQRIAPDIRARRNLPGPKTGKEALAEWERRKWDWESSLPLRGFPPLLEVAPWYDEWLAHPDDGPFWEFADMTKAYARMNVPALHFSSWYDSNYGPTGAIENFNGMRARAATPEVRRAQKLVLGPWGHGDPTEHETAVGELSFGPSMTIDYYGLVLRWHDRWLKGIRNGIDEEPPVRIFVMGENTWRDEHEWPLARTRWATYHLESGGAANTAAGDGWLSEQAPAAGGRAGPPDQYLYDPAHPVTLENFESMGPFDRSRIQARRDVLVYTTEPLAEDREVTGPVVVHLWAASSAVDTDFVVMLCDVRPDGKAYNLMPMEAGMIRARYRNSESAPALLTPGTPAEFVISGMVTSNLFKKGHLIRLEVTSSRFPHFDRNPNTGEPFGASKRMVPARQTVYHDAAHPSRLILPVIPRSAEAG